MQTTPPRQHRLRTAQVSASYASEDIQTTRGMNWKVSAKKGLLGTYRTQETFTNCTRHQKATTPGPPSRSRQAMHPGEAGGSRAPRGGGGRGARMSPSSSGHAAARGCSPSHPQPARPPVRKQVPPDRHTASPQTGTSTARTAGGRFDNNKLTERLPPRGEPPALRPPLPPNQPAASLASPTHYAAGHLRHGAPPCFGFLICGPGKRRMGSRETGSGLSRE